MLTDYQAMQDTGPLKYNGLLHHHKISKLKQVISNTYILRRKLSINRDLVIELCKKKKKRGAYLD